MPSLGSFLLLASFVVCAYAIQGRAARFIERIEGSWSNVVGLPVATVYRLLHEVR